MLFLFEYPFICASTFGAVLAFQGAIFIILVLEIILLVCKDNGDVNSPIGFDQHFFEFVSIDRSLHCF